MYLHNLRQFSVHVPQLILVHYRTPASHLNTVKTHMLISCILFPPFNFDFKTNFNLFCIPLQTFLSCLFVWFYLSISIIPRYLHPILSISLTIYPLGSTRQFSFTLPYLRLPSRYFRWRNIHFTLMNVFGPYPERTICYHPRIIGD